MSDFLQPTPLNTDAASAASDGDFAPTEIDARHAQQLIERAFAHLERDERDAAEIAVRQAIHLSPGVAAMHSFAGLLGLLSDDMEAAHIGYENAVQDFSKASLERERLIALRMAQVDNSKLNVADFVPSLPQEIARLRAAIAQTPLQEFLSLPVKANHVASLTASPRVSSNNAIAAPSPLLSSESQTEARPAFASRLQQRKRASAWAVGIAAASAAIVAFFVMRSLVAPKTAPPVGSTPVANQVAVETAPPAPDTVNGAIELPAVNGTDSTPDDGAPDSNAADAGSTSDGGASEPTAIVTVKPLPPASTAPVTSPRPAPKPAPKPPAPKPAPPAAVPIIPGLPRPAPTRPTTPREIPTPIPIPRETPRDPNFPAMPPPKITLPSAGGEKTEFPRVLPDND